MNPIIARDATVIILEHGCEVAGIYHSRQELHGIERAKYLLFEHGCKHPIFLVSFLSMDYIKSRFFDDKWALLAIDSCGFGRLPLSVSEIDILAKKAKIKKKVSAATRCEYFTEHIKKRLSVCEHGANFDIINNIEPLYSLLLQWGKNTAVYTAVVSTIKELKLSFAGSQELTNLLSLITNASSLQLQDKNDYVIKAEAFGKALSFLFNIDSSSIEPNLLKDKVNVIRSSYKSMTQP